jgi:hypothetical protein
MIMHVFGEATKDSQNSSQAIDQLLFKASIPSLICQVVK